MKIIFVALIAIAGGVYLYQLSSLDKDISNQVAQDLLSQTNPDALVENDAKLLSTRIFTAMAMSWAEWGTYPSKVKYTTSEYPEKDTLHLDGKPVLMDVPVEVRIIESGATGKAVFEWKNKLFSIDSKKNFEVKNL